MNNRKKWTSLFVVLLSLLMVMGFATICVASGHAANMPISQPEGAPPAIPNVYVIGWTAVNFFALLALLYKFAFNPINQMLEERTNTIESSIKHAEEVRSEIDQMRKEAQANLGESRKQAQEIVSRATKAAEEAKAEISSKANEEATNMKKKALDEIDAATEQAKLEIKDLAASLAIMAAEKVLERAITDEDNNKMVKKFIDEAGDYLC